MAEKGTVASLVDWIMGGAKTRPLRTTPKTPPQDNTMVKAAAEDAAMRARMRGELAPEAGIIMATPVKPKPKP